MRIFNKVTLPVDQPFVVNKYTYWYYAIIEHALQRHTNEYSELHHIIPDCFFIENRSKGKRPGWIGGNSNDPINLVRLTFKEHFVCHWILTKITPGSAAVSMERALVYMAGKGTNRGRHISAGQYARARLAAYLCKIGQPSGKKGKTYGPQKNPFRGVRIGPNRGRTIPLQTKLKIGKTLKGRPSPRKGKFGQPNPKKGTKSGIQKNPAAKLSCELCGRLIASNNMHSHKRKCESIKLGSLSIT